MHLLFLAFGVLSKLGFVGGGQDFLHARRGSSQASREQASFFLSHRVDLVLKWVRGEVDLYFSFTQDFNPETTSPKK